ncbi:hypothetical protein V1506DRAFT_519688 [Lipomyces tetrasporus]
MRHCVLHQGEYVRRRKGQFWKDIARVFEAETDTRVATGVPIRKPGQTVENLVKERREQLGYRSGVAEADTELKQALDAFMQRFDDVEREKQDLLAKKEDMAEAKAKTKAIRSQMMLGRKRSDDEDGGGGGGGSECAVSPVCAANAIASWSHQPSPEEETTISFDRATELEVQVRDVDEKVSELSKQFFEGISSMDEKLDRLFKKL